MNDKLFDNPEEFAKYLKTLPDKKTNEAMLCPYCLKLGKKISRNDSTHKVWDDESSEFKRVVCDSEKDHLVSLYYDTKLRSPEFNHVEIPKDSPFLNLYNPENNTYTKKALIYGDHFDFCVHLKAFIQKMVLNYKVPNFSYSFINMAQLRDLKFSDSIGGNRNLAKYNNVPILIFDFNVRQWNAVSDSGHLSELVSHRENNFLPLWMISEKPIKHLSLYNNTLKKDEELIEKLDRFTVIQLPESEGKLVADEIATDDPVRKNKLIKNKVKKVK